MKAERHQVASVSGGLVGAEGTASRRSSARGAARTGEGFLGTERYAVEGVLGEGGMGIVYRARDLDRGGVVALKTILHETPATILDFKREFRALAELSHPNVVELHELVQEGGTWFFTMELIEGTTFLDHVWHGPPPPGAGRGTAGAVTIDAPTFLGVAATERAGAGAVRPLPSGALPATPAVDEARLRDALGQLADGLSAIHEGGKLHCDLKPSNVLVSREGRVVLVDFGISVGHGEDPCAAGPDRRPRGTPIYMAPEQAALLPLGPAADWYAVGAILYEALTGRVPFEGPVMAMLLAKQHERPAPPDSLARGVPADLAALAMDLLAPRAEDRPRGEEVLARLGWRRRALSIRQTTGGLDAPTFVGRDRERMALAEALGEAMGGRLSVAFVGGASGLGKSALCARFLEDARRVEDALVLSGRCYEREAVPYKAFDALFDALARHLRSLPPDEARAVLPAEVHALARLFPALEEVAPPPSERTAAALDELEPLELRRRAFGAAKALLRELGGRHRLVLLVDDAQWGDADSARLLDALLEPPDAPSMLLVLAYRSEHEATSEMLIETRHLRDRRGTRAIELRPLAEDEAEQVARALLRRGGRAPEAAAPGIARESRGSPSFVQELVQFEEERAGTTDPGTASVPASLDEVLRARVLGVPPEARRLLEVVAIGCGPLELDVALRAATLGGHALSPLSTLRAAKLVRTYRQGERAMIETFHDRVRQVTSDALAPEARRTAHARLARELVATGRADPEILVGHFLAAERAAEARRWALVAADAASRSLAFSRAARLYAVAIELGEDAAATHARHADALACAGRGIPAARAYLAAAARAEGPLALSLRRLAAKSLLEQGRMDEGLPVLRGVLAETGEPYPETLPRLALGLAGSRLRLAAASLSFEPRSERDVPARLLARVDAAYTATVGLSLTDPIRGLFYGERQLLLALEAREPFRVCRALALAAAGRSALGVAARAPAERLMRAAEALAAELDHPETVALARLAAGNVPFFFGEWRRARAALDEAEALLEEHCRNVAWERTNTHFQGANVRIFLGELGDAARRVPAIVREALERSDLFALSNMTYAATITHLIADDVAQARSTAWATDAGGTYTTGRWGALVGAVSVERYLGEGRRALARARADWPTLSRSVLMRVELVRVSSLFELGLCAVAATLDGGSHLDEAEAIARRLLGEAPGYARAMGHHLLAAVASARGRRERALAHLDEAVAGLERAELGYLAAVARVRRGTARGGAGGDAEREAALAWLSARGVRAPLRCVAMSMPDRSDER